MTGKTGLSTDLVGKGLIISAPASGSGKTLVTLGILRVLSRRGTKISSAKAGPDYIDPRFHDRASGAECVNIDPWAMRDGYAHMLAGQLLAKSPLLIEGMMGLFDGAADGSGSVADLAVLLGLPILLVVDASRQSHSIAALVGGFQNHRADVNISGIIFNKVGSKRHETMLREALQPTGVPVVGAIRKDATLVMPERHLGLVQAGEHGDLEAFINQAADIIERSLDIELLMQLFLAPGRYPDPAPAKLAPLGQHIAIASDQAFAFCYPHLVNGWRDQGASISFFSPLGDEAPDQHADAVYLPGGYPELHAGRLASCSSFWRGLATHAARGDTIYGECGGYMVLGQGLVDGAGRRHKMAGLLPLTTSFEHPKLHLGYRSLQPLTKFPGIPDGGHCTGHEFHYASTVDVAGEERLFDVCDALGNSLGQAGLRRAGVMGSFMHLIDVRNN